MKFNRYKGFTVAELMITLAVLTVLLAAFAPVFTVRYKNAVSDTVWNYVPNDDQYDAYADNVNKALPAQLFIGLQPGSKSEAETMVSNGVNTLYSKLIIRASNKLNGVDNEKQKQIRFQYGEEYEGKEVGSLFAGNQSILLGGTYKKITDDAKDNISFGYNSMNAVTSGKRNSVFGYNAAEKLTTGEDNTVIGYKAGSGISSGSKNTYIGTETGSSSGSYNVALGNYSGPKGGSYNTIVGEYAATGSLGDYNTAVGYQALEKNAGSYNTAVGTYAMGGNGTIGGYNTGIGYGACSGLSGSAAKKTCIGVNSGAYVTNNSENGFLLSDDIERVFIGSIPVAAGSGSTKMGGAAVLEIHNINKQRKNGQEFYMGDSTVLINGNLIVRGQPFLTGYRGRLAGGQDKHPKIKGPALYGFKEERPKDATHLHTLMGWDARRKHVKVKGRRNKTHARYGAGESCTCAKPCGGDNTNGYKSYDWSSAPASTTDYVTLDVIWHKSYNDESTGRTCSPDETNHDNNGIDLNHAHGGFGTCCPILTSDIRLKDLGDNFTEGLEQIKKINVFNYTYKTDEEQLPHVGVIAQDLKRIFPSAVSKDENGYYKIRWDEMLYAVINSIKTLNAKIEAISDKIANDKARIATLKKDNATLTKQVKVLADELSELENKNK